MDINTQIARQLGEVADLLAEQGANLFRVHAYRRGAETVRHLARPVDEILALEGVEGLRKLCPTATKGYFTRPAFRAFC